MTSYEMDTDGPNGKLDADSKKISFRFCREW